MRISAIIPAYNRARLLPLTLRSLLAQSVPADEVIVVDDGSNDGTAEVAEAFGGTVRVIRQANAGPAAARNAGFRASRGRFIHFFDSDDVALPNKHEVQVRSLEESGADIAYGPWVKGSFTDVGFHPENAILQQHGLPRGDLIRALLTNWSIVPHACLFRRSIVERVGGFPEDLFGTEDQMMFLNCLLEGAKVVHSPGTLELYRSDNLGKITDATQGQGRHLREWARFLLSAARRCEAGGINPKSWFGFRRRIWEALSDINRSGVSSPEIEAGLAELLEGGPPWFLYSIERELRRKSLGLRQRLRLGRASACFRAGWMDSRQKDEMAKWEESERQGIIEYQRQTRD